MYNHYVSTKQERAKGLYSATPKKKDIKQRLKEIKEDIQKEATTLTKKELQAIREQLDNVYELLSSIQQYEGRNTLDNVANNMVNQIIHGTSYIEEKLRDVIEQHKQQKITEAELIKSLNSYCRLYQELHSSYFNHLGEVSKQKLFDLILAKIYGGNTHG